jgi:hypothetical protein
MTHLLLPAQSHFFSILNSPPTVFELEFCGWS